VLLQKAAGVEKGSGTPNSVKVGSVTRAQIKVRPPLAACAAPAGLCASRACTSVEPGTMRWPACLVPYGCRQRGAARGLAQSPPAARHSVRCAGRRADLCPAGAQEIAEIKLPDLNAITVDAAMKIIEGTAKNMGVTVSD
jgi:hypothetical protein